MKVLGREEEQMRYNITYPSTDKYRMNIGIGKRRAGKEEGEEEEYRYPD
jgi:hypothetical protein